MEERAWAGRHNPPQAKGVEQRHSRFYSTGTTAQSSNAGRVNTPFRPTLVSGCRG
jgi:hypothetical protein